ncbi:MAG: PLP-dependent transferase [Bryobacteraceae bacterium]
MSHPEGPHTAVRPRTAVLTRGYDPALSFGSARPAVFRSSTYVFANPEEAERAFGIMAGRVHADDGERPDLIYSRFSHPNAEILEDQIVPLEPGARAAAVFNSGMAAIMTAFVTVARPGTTIVYTTPLYGGTTGLIHNFLEPFGVHSVGVPAGDAEGLDEAIRTAQGLSIVYLETPANPTLAMVDLRRAIETSRKQPDHPVVMVDNTFLGPMFQHPLMLGADLSLYSATKYLSGNSDMVAGVALSRDPELMRKILAKRSMFGNILQPDECWMLNSRLSTVSLRMNRQSKNAQRLAEALQGHKKLARVLYPTLVQNADQRRIFEEQCTYPGGLFSLDFAGGKSAAFDFLRNLRIGRNAVSLGGVETLVCHPRSTTHSGMSQQELDEAGIGEGLVRVSVGIEDWRDLLADFEQALEHVK